MKTSPFHLRLKRSLPHRIDLSAILPASIVERSRSEIAAIEVTSDHGRSRVDDWFEFEGDPSQAIVLHGDLNRADSIGRKLSEGSIEVFGDVGVEVGHQMSGGLIKIHGSAGNRLAQGMTGGRIFVEASAGDQLGANLPGSKRGISGGEVWVFGDVGADACSRMRRGTVVIGGKTGPRLATEMIAGTIFVVGPIGPNWGSGMRRGTLLLGSEGSEAPWGLLTESRPLELSFLPILWRSMRASLGECGYDQHLSIVPKTRWTKRSLGDRSVHGVGEVLWLLPYQSNANQEGNHAS